MTTTQDRPITANRQTLIAALYAFIGQRSGIEWGNYGGSREAFMGDYRPILRHGHHARQMLRYVELSGITAEALIEATSAFCGRLQFIQRDNGVGIDYTTGQYFPTEYRNAACAVLARAIWHHWRPDCGTGDDIRRRARREFGRAVESTWFN